MDYRRAADSYEGILPTQRAGPLPPLLPRHRVHPHPVSVFDAMYDLLPLSLDLQVPVPISPPPVVEDPIASQVTVFDNRFVESLHDLKGMQLVAHKMKEDMMSTIGLNEAGSLMRRAHQPLLFEEGGIAQQFKVGMMRLTPWRLRMIKLSF